MTDQDLEELFVLANTEINRASKARGGVLVSSLQELQNGTQHRIRARTAGSSVEREAYLMKAASHYTRATMDAIHARLLAQLEAFRDFKAKFSKYGTTEDIPKYIEADKVAAEVRVQLLTHPTAVSDVNQLRSLADNLEARLNSLLQDQETVTRVLDRARTKWRQHIFTSLAALVASIIAAVITSIPAFHRAPQGVREHIEQLDTIQKSLQNLQGYVSSQKETLTDLNRSVTDLKSQKAELERIVHTGADTVDIILRNYNRTQHVSRWIELAVSFLIGVFSSLTATLIVNYRRRTKEQPSLEDIRTTMGKKE